MLLQESFDLLQVLETGELRAAVTGTFDNNHGGVRARLFQRRGKGLALGDRHGLVLVAVHDQERRRILRHVGHRAGFARRFLVRLRVAAEQAGARAFGPDREEVRGAIPIGRARTLD